MMDGYCEDCGCKVYSGHCINCHEEVFIAEQYRDLGETIPDVILDKASEQEYKPSKTI